MTPAQAALLDTLESLMPLPTTNRHALWILWLYPAYQKGLLTYDEWVELGAVVNRAGIGKRF